MSVTKRRPNFTEEELVALANAVKEKEDILFGQFAGKNVSRNTKIVAWNEVRNSVNAVGGNSRDTKEIQIKHKNLKTTTKKIESGNRREIYKTGGGKAKLKNLSESQKIILGTIPEACVSGIIGGIDLHEKGKEIVPQFVAEDEDRIDIDRIDEDGIDEDRSFLSQMEGASFVFDEPLVNEALASEGRHTNVVHDDDELLDVGPSTSRQLQLQLNPQSPNFNSPDTRPAPTPKRSETPLQIKRRHRKIKVPATELLMREGRFIERTNFCF